VVDLATSRAPRSRCAHDFHRGLRTESPVCPVRIPGGSLARLEGQIAIRAIAAELPSLRLGGAGWFFEAWGTPGDLLKQ
jgi:hypothetical protein